MTRSSEELKTISGYGQEAARRYWCKSTRPTDHAASQSDAISVLAELLRLSLPVGNRRARFPIGGNPKPPRSCPMERHSTATALTLDYLANRESELIQFNPEVL